ncbi:MAG: MjaI family restriction endonuclease [bacterium]
MENRLVSMILMKNGINTLQVIGTFQVKSRINTVYSQVTRSKGIDGYIGEIPVSIKPHTYQVKVALPEHIETKIIYYMPSANFLSTSLKAKFLII